MVHPLFLTLQFLHRVPKKKIPHGKKLIGPIVATLGINKHKKRCTPYLLKPERATSAWPLLHLCAEGPVAHPKKN